MASFKRNRLRENFQAGKQDIWSITRQTTEFRIYDFRRGDEFQDKGSTLTTIRNGSNSTWGYDRKKQPEIQMVAWVMEYHKSDSKKSIKTYI